MKLLKTIIFISFIGIACYWTFTRDLSISPLLMLAAGLLFIVKGLSTINGSANKQEVYWQCGLGVSLLLLAFL
ncbi:hypothetical protein [Pseudobacillus wudalianchiensis]|uniref:DUF3953 domain-containing protein n=1 Tax=Pseudobacillus wudalianchiensis TaxID=1743143 RepID=A0A1B9ADQ7_9BACI|nr:hypothetical protein [Bacillus wudalianchiensis]OCA81975.1 hypothetical protein A8F95_14785 [Bacillus wudalianchiensis]